MALRAVAPGSASINSSQIRGTTTNDNAATGVVGEYTESVVLQGAAVPFVTTNVPINITSISLTAGDWDVSGVLNFENGSVTTQCLGWISSASATLPTAPSGGLVGLGIAFTAGQIFYVATGIVRFSLSATTTVFLSARASFSGTPGDAFGILRARRVR